MKVKIIFPLLKYLATDVKIRDTLVYDKLFWDVQETVDAFNKQLPNWDEHIVFNPVHFTITNIQEVRAVELEHEADITLNIIVS